MYTGIEFDIKGTATGHPPWWTFGDNVAEVALVTAETQSQSFGGDAPCKLGHFYAYTPAFNSTGWTHVTFKWSDFITPNYLDPDCTDKGITAYPADVIDALATGKLQAIDWGFYKESTNVDVYIDNVKLTTN
jgi:hypothetical protein